MATELRPRAQTDTTALAILPHVIYPESLSRRGARRRGERKKWHEKVRTGCLNCKDRRIKCDEAKPNCAKCTKAGLSCLGYHPPKPRVFDINNITISDSDSPLERKFILYFHSHRHGSRLLSQCQLSTLSFWKTLAPQASQHHPAVKAVLVAIGCFHQAICRQTLDLQGEDENYANATFALSQYNKAIHLLSKTNATKLPIELILTCCLLFAAMTMWVEKSSTPAMHAHAGWLLMQDHAKSVSRGEAVEIAGLKEIYEPNFKRLIISSCTFQDGYPPPNSPIPLDYELEYDVELPISFAGYTDALHFLTGILKCVLRTTLHSTPYHLAVQGRIRQQLPLYLNALQLTSTKLYPSSSTGLHEQFRPLLIHHRMIKTLLSTLPSTSETIFDNHHYDFNFILNESEWFLAHEPSLQLRDLAPFHPSLGILPPLFFTATRCRNGALRRRAVTLLHRASRSERRWTSCIATALAQFVVAAEGQLDPSTAQIAVPDAQRVRLTGVDFSRKDKLMFVSYTRNGQLESVTLPYVPDATVDLNQEFMPMSRKILRACGYTGVGLYQPTVPCNCGYVEPDTRMVG